MAKIARKNGVPRLIDEWHFNNDQEQPLTIRALLIASRKDEPSGNRKLTGSS
jgi:hypothetical protein